MAKKSETKVSNSWEDFLPEKPPQKLPKLIAQTESQKECIRGIVDNTISLILGPAGSGKSILPLGLACDWLLRGEYEKILVVRPIVAAGTGLGFLPGELSDKIEPYFWPADDYIKHFLGHEYDMMIKQKKIEYIPLQLLRGHTRTKNFMILDEGQNATKKQIKLFLTRIGAGSKCLINGDPHQADIHNSGLLHTYDRLANTKDVYRHMFNHSDILRHPIISHILRKLEQ